jgi:hypothetical protein
MKSEKHGYAPVSSSQEYEAFKAAGWTDCGPPPWPKPGAQEAPAAPAVEEEPAFDPNAIVMSEDSYPVTDDLKDGELTIVESTASNKRGRKSK